MTQCLPSGSNQDGISKPNTAPQLLGTVVHDRNTKEDPKNKVNQNELPQLITNILATSLKLKHLQSKKQKLKTKQRVSRQKYFHYYQARPSSK